tara:strand:- start:48 stop:317 length:270 start_codon:yes stop_codon:yes gene_type:complete
MKKIYTCFFKVLTINKETLKNVLFVSVDDESWLEVKYQKVDIEHYDQIAKMFQGRYDKKKKVTWYHITFGKRYLQNLAINNKAIFKLIK